MKQRSNAGAYWRNVKRMNEKSAHRIMADPSATAPLIDWAEKVVGPPAKTQQQKGFDFVEVKN